MSAKTNRLPGFSLISAVAALVLTVACAGSAVGNSIDRLGPEDAFRMASSGQALLVCSYDDHRCRSMLLEHALLRSEFEARAPSLSPDQAVIFY